MPSVHLFLWRGNLVLEQHPEFQLYRANQGGWEAELPHTLVASTVYRCDVLTQFHELRPLKSLPQPPKPKPFFLQDEQDFLPEDECLAPDNVSRVASGSVPVQALLDGMRFKHVCDTATPAQFFIALEALWPWGSFAEAA